MTLTNSTVSNAVYGGGNNAQVYGSTNLSASNLTAETFLVVGNAGDVLNNSQVEVSGSTITGSIYGGGNSAAVLGGYRNDGCRYNDSWANLSSVAVIQEQSVSKVSMPLRQRSTF